MLYTAVEVMIMSITAKQYLVKQLGAELSATLTARDLETVQSKLNEMLSMFEVSGIEAGSIDTDSEDFLQAFFDAKRIEGRSEKTLAHYDYILRRMFDEINTPIRRVTVFHLRSYLMQLKKRGVADKTLEGIRSVMSSYFGWLQKEGLLAENPCANLAPIKCEKKVRHPYSEVELVQLLEACKSDRDRAIIRFLLSTGCRISEVCALNVADVDFKNRECVVNGKGNKQRVVFFDDVSALMLRRYLDSRTDEEVALFVGKGTSRMTPGGIRAMLRNVASNAHVDNVHPHRFRRTLATNLINHGMQIQEVAAVLGHDKLDTTMKYVYVDKTNVKNAYTKYA